MLELAGELENKNKSPTSSYLCNRILFYKKYINKF